MSQSHLATLSHFFRGLGTIFSVVGKIVRALITLILVGGLVVWVVLIVNALNSQSEAVPESGALRIDLSGVLLDERTYEDPINLLMDQEGPTEHRVYDLVRAIDAAAEDDRITHVVLLLHQFMGGGSSKIVEVGEALKRFRETGKPVYASSDFYNQPAYLLASYADEIHLNPFGFVDLRGLATYRSYYGDAIDKLRVNVNVFRTSDYKDALEPFIGNEMSDASRAQTELWLGDIWQQWQQLIEQNRPQLDESRLTRYSDEFDQLMLEYEGDAALVALETGLVDQLMTRDQTLSRFIRQIGPQDEQGQFYAHINYLPYLDQVETSTAEDAVRIGLITASGTILAGRQPAGSIGGDSLSLQLRGVRQRDNIDALVLRIDSPGGSAFASELIRRELELIAESGIPVVVSFSSVAASGGYWIAMPADEIWAMPTSITGSIGAFSAVPTFEDSLNALGISSDGVATGPLAGALNLDRALSDQAKTILQSSLEHLYGEFVSLVSESRDIELDELSALAEGRVWSGQQAQSLGLVDHLGGLDMAIQSAAALAGNAEQFRVREVERVLTWREELARLLGGSVSVLFPGLGQSQLQNWLGRLGLEQDLSLIDGQLSDPAHQYLICASCSSGRF